MADLEGTPLDADEAAPAAQVDPEAQAPGSVPSPTEKASKTNKFRALRDRIALHRSFSTKHTSVSSPNLLSPALENLEEEKGVPAVSPTRVKSNAFGRLITGRLGAKKGGKKAQDADAAPIPIDLEAAPSGSSASTQPEGEGPPDSILEVDGPPTTVASEQETAGQNANPEPLPFAHKIQSLLSSLPPFLPTFDDASSPGGSNGTDGNTGAAPSPDPPSVIPDSRLLSLLSSPSMMNGSISRGRQSVWAMLDNLRLKALQPNARTFTAASQGPAGDAHGITFVEDDDSIMFYGPLVPDQDSAVELARSEIVSVDEDGTILDVILDDAPLPCSPPTPPSLSPGAKKEAFHWPWPFHRDAPPPPPKKTTEKRVWVPSTTQLSVQVMWWGYRLWLPPPVLAMLNDKEIEAAKLAAMLTTALQWLLNNVPESALPPALQPALALMKSLVPYLGYIGGFVAWSWSAIRGFDIGNGVTLSATWLLPIALIPGTWENADIPKPPTTDPSTPSTPAPNNPSDPSTTNPTAPGTSGPSAPSGNPPATPPANPTPPASPAPPVDPMTPSTEPPLDMRLPLIK